MTWFIAARWVWLSFTDFSVSLPSLPGHAHLAEAAGSAATPCHTPSHSASFVFIPMAACQAQAQNHALAARLPQWAIVHERACPPLPDRGIPTFVPPHPKSRRSNWAADGQVVRGGEGEDACLCSGRAGWPLSCRHTLLTKSDHPARARERSLSSQRLESDPSSPHCQFLFQI